MINPCNEKMLCTKYSFKTPLLQIHSRRFRRKHYTVEEVTGLERRRTSRPVPGLPLLCAVHQPRAPPLTRTQPPEAGVGAQTYMAQLPKPPLPRCLTRSQWLQTTPHLPHAETVPAPQRTPVPHRSRPHTRRRAANPSCRIGPSDGRARGKQPSSHLSARDPRVPPHRRGNGRS